MPKAKTSARQTDDKLHPQLEFPLAPTIQPDDAPEGDAPGNSAPDSAGPEEAEAPTFAMVRESGIDGEKRCLYLVVESTAGEHFRLDFTPGCIPLAVAALSAELGFLRQHQPDLDEAVQPIVVDSCQIGEMPNGNPALLAGMEGGGELPLQLSLPDLQKLNNRISEYIRGKALTRPFG